MSVADSGREALSSGTRDQECHATESGPVRSKPGCCGSRCNEAGDGTGCNQPCRPTRPVNVRQLRRNHGTITTSPSSDLGQGYGGIIPGEHLRRWLDCYTETPAASGGHPLADSLSFDSQKICLGVQPRSDRLRSAQDNLAFPAHMGQRAFDLAGCRPRYSGNVGAGRPIHRRPNGSYYPGSTPIEDPLTDGTEPADDHAELRI